MMSWRGFGRIAAIAILAVVLTGCGTIMNFWDRGGPHVFGGTVYSAKHAVRGISHRTILWSLDLPFSFMADSILLPATIYHQTTPGKAARRREMGKGLYRAIQGNPTINNALNNR